MRVLVHPGFHKTGTTSLQYALKQLADHLDPQLRTLFSDAFPEAVLAARRYSAAPAARKLEKFAGGLTTALAGIDENDPRPLLISSEQLIGRIPGRVGNWSYATTPALVGRAVDVLRDRFGETAEITVWFTTRRPEDWLRSVYWQNLRSMRITEEFDTYRARLAPAARLDEVVAETREGLSGRALVCASAIEEIGGERLGPLGTALERLGLPTDKLPPVQAFNVQPKGGAVEMLALNRSSLDDEALAEAKRDLLQAYRRSGETRRRPG